MTAKAFLTAIREVLCLPFSLCSKVKPALVFDLDNTLVYSTELETKTYKFTTIVGNKKYYVHVRPGACKFLQKLSEFYDIHFFTASSKAYSEIIIEKIAPFVKSNNCFYKDSCIFKFGYAIKDLNIINWPIEKVLLIDDIIGSGSMQPNNIIGVKPWNGEDTDRVLCDDLLPILLKCSKENNMPLSVKKWANKLSTKNLTFLKEKTAAQ